MKRGVVVSTWPGGREMCERLLMSLQKCPYPVYVVVNNIGGNPAIPAVNESWVHWFKEFVPKKGAGWWVYLNDAPGFELGTIATVLRETELDEFLLLQDSFEVKDVSFIEEVMEDPRSVALGPTFFHYAGKWKRSLLERMEIPVVETKQQSIHQEHTFSRLYWELGGPEEVWVFDPHFHDGEHRGFVEAYGRRNMLLENRHYRKYKGTWG